MKFTYLNGYRFMWIIVMFDLPTQTVDERKSATDFRKFLLDEGFNMLQYSIYIRHCTGMEQAEAYERRIAAILPKSGIVETLCITDKQYSKIKTYYGGTREQKRTNPEKVLMIHNTWESFLEKNENC